MSSLPSAKATLPRFLDALLVKVKSVRAIWWHYGVAFLSVAIVVGVERIFPQLFRDYPYRLFWAVIAFNAWYGGIGPGIAATVFSVFNVNYFMILPVYGLQFTLNDGLALIVGTVITLFINIPGLRTRRLHQALAENEERFRSVLENMPVLMSVNNAQGQRIFWNKEAERVTGYSLQEVVGNPKLGDLLYPDRAYQAEIERFRQERRGDWRNWELVTRCKDGSTRIISWSNISKHYPVPGWEDWALGVDVTESKWTRRRTALLQNITAALSAAATPQQISTIILEQCLPVLGAAAGSIVGLSSDTQWLAIILSTGYSSETIQPYLRFPVTLDVPLAEAVRIRQPVWLHNQDMRNQKYPTMQEQTTGYKAWAALPLLVEDRVLGGLGFSFAQEQAFTTEEQEFMMSMASLCAQALERARLFEAESAARQEAEKANALKLQFLGMIAHELRTPLSSIKGFASTLLADDVEFDLSSQREFLTVIDQEADRLSELVSQLLDLARLQASSMTIQPESQSLGAIVDAAMPNLKTLTTYHELVIDVPHDLPPVTADTSRIVQVILNLVGNAARYAPSFTSITLRAHQSGDRLQVDVSDHGPGIPLEDHVRVFEAFSQGSEQLKQRSQGAGLGLAICKGLVEAHGGMIWIHDQPPPGTTISFTLPLVKQQR